MLVQRNGADLILQRYPRADDGKVPFLVPIAENDRYAVLRVVPAQAPGGQQKVNETNTQGNQGGTGTSTTQQNTQGAPSANGANQPSTTPAIGAGPAGR
jgi:hypothetical protein